jgi:2-methylcitrate dehydratase PrpD
VSADNRLAQILEWLWEAKAPAAVQEKGRELVLDTVGCVLAAAAKRPLKDLSRAMAGTDRGAASVPGFAELFSVPGAGALFAAAACWDEACEGLARAHGRPGVPVIAALVALRKIRSVTLAEALGALVAGYEVGGRLGEALRVPGGMHVDATWPGLGVAVAVVRLCGGTAAQALSAVRIAGCQIPRSLYLPVKAGAEARNTYLSHSVQLGLLAAQAALAGFTVPEGVLDELGAGGFAAPGEWLTLQAYLKPFAAVRHVHYAAAAALELRPKVGARLQSVTGIELCTYAEALRYCGNRAPQTAIQAQFSLSYGTACALATGELAPDSYAPSILQDRMIRELEAKISLSEDTALTSGGKRGARLTVFTTSERWESIVEEVEGDPGRPMSRSAVIAKFARYARRSPRAAEALFTANSGENFAALLEQLASPA